MQRGRPDETVFFFIGLPGLMALTERPPVTPPITELTLLRGLAVFAAGIISAESTPGSACTRITRFV